MGRDGSGAGKGRVAEGKSGKGWSEMGREGSGDGGWKAWGARSHAGVAKKHRGDSKHFEKWGQVRFSLSFD